MYNICKTLHVSISVSVYSQSIHSIYRESGGFANVNVLCDDFSSKIHARLFFNGFSLFIECEITDIHNLRLSRCKATSDILNTADLQTAQE